MVRKRGGFKAFVRKRDGKDLGKFWFKGGCRSSGQVEGLKRILSGDTSALFTAFVWSDTPQGSRHWARIRLGEQEMTKEDYEYILYLMDNHT